MSQYLRIAIVLIAAVAACSASWAADAPTIPQAVDRKIDFAADIKPLLARHCAGCHAGREANGGFSIDTRESVLAGGDSGAAVVPGESGESLLVHLVAGLDEDRVMPADGRRLTAGEVGLLRAWIDQQLDWQADFSFEDIRDATLAPRRPELPEPAGNATLVHPIDRLLADNPVSFDEETAQPVSDRTFARRVYLDLVGLLPPPDELQAFLDDRADDKRGRLVRRLLDDREAYATHWLSFWNDLLRNEYRGTGFIDDGRRQITEWLYRSLYDNKPYDEFVSELISPVPGSEGFSRGIVWRGVVNASQRQELQAAQNIAQVFLGTNLKCASCHDSFVNQWKLADAYGLASVFAESPLELYRCDKPTGEIAEVRFLFPQLGSIDAAAPKEQRMQQLADLVTSENNGRFTRTIVNRLWAKLLGRGLVEPIDEMENEPWNADLLDWLAVDLADHDYDLKRTLELICTSRTYQLPSVGAPRPDETVDTFRGPLVRRMTAEQFIDAAAALLDVSPDIPNSLLQTDGRGQGGQMAGLRDVLAASVDVSADNILNQTKWIWNHERAAEGVEAGRVYFRKTFHLDRRPERAVAAITCDNEFRLFINGTLIAGGKNWNEPRAIDVNDLLTPGENLLAVEALNTPGGKNGEEQPEPSAAGLIAVVVGGEPTNPDWTVATDANWLCATEIRGGWELADYDTAGWKHAVEVAPADGEPWQIADRMAANLELADNSLRASLEFSDPLMSALGRPNREQVVTRRDSLATMLQALELTNGRTLDDMLGQGARHWLAREQSTDALVQAIYLQSLGREPTETEMAIAVNLAGSPPTEEGLADVLWTVLMLPEFQLIY